MDLQLWQPCLYTLTKAFSPCGRCQDNASNRGPISLREVDLQGSTTVLAKTRIRVRSWPLLFPSEDEHAVGVQATTAPTCGTAMEARELPTSWQQAGHSQVVGVGLASARADGVEPGHHAPAAAGHEVAPSGVPRPQESAVWRPEEWRPPLGVKEAWRERVAPRPSGHRQPAGLVARVLLGLRVAARRQPAAALLLGGRPLSARGGPLRGRGTALQGLAQAHCGIVEPKQPDCDARCGLLLPSLELCFIGGGAPVDAERHRQQLSTRRG
mmetsp:Transcript_16291/g.44873  ORF Transcript_16291/g.44873 Transcript_16291/m.44873 type:complete len:269 (-) Transcript_16291:417-1223(-)